MKEGPTSQKIPDGSKLGESKKPTSGGSCLVVSAIGLFVFLMIVGALMNSDASKDSTSAPAVPQRHLTLTITKVEYQYGYFTVVGSAKNDGEAGIFSPTIELEIYDSTGKTLLATGPGWPAGQLLQTMPPGLSAAFQLIEHVPGEPSQVTWRIRAKDCPFEVQDSTK